MSTFAVLSKNKVTDIIVAELQEITESVFSSTCIEYTDNNTTGTNCMYDSITKIFSPSVPVDLITSS